MNTSDGKAKLIEVNSPWFFSEDPSADIAVLPYRPDSKIFVYRTVPLSMFVTDDLVAQKGIGVGDELYMAGLFTRRFGSDCNRPIVRSGIIAAMPDEPIPDSKTGLSFSAYIAEVRSIGGLSGSPVFVALGPARAHNGQITLELQFALLGVVRGHWDEKSTDSIPGMRPKSMLSTWVWQLSRPLVQCSTR